MALILNSCNVRKCDRAPNYKITYDCGEGEPDQTIEICQVHYDFEEPMPSGEPFYPFKRFIKNIEVLNYE